MANFPGFALTNQGQALLAKAISGAQLEFSKVAMGAGELSGSIADLTDLIDIKIDNIGIMSIARDGENSILRVSALNVGVSAPFLWREIGVYAIDPDEGEILYAASNAGSSADVVPAPVTTVMNYLIDIVSFVGQAADVTAIMPPPSSVFVTRDELQSTIQIHALDIHPHLNLLIPGDFIQSANQQKPGFLKCYAGIPLISEYPELYAAIGNDFDILDIWTKRTPDNAFSGGFTALVYAVGTFVLAGTAGEIQTSPDGITWTHRTPDDAFSGQFQHATYGSGLFVLVGGVGEIQTSPDGITWTHRIPQWSEQMPTLVTATYGNGLFVLAGSPGAIQTSPDGITWTQRTPAGSFAGQFLTATYGNGLFVLAGTAGEIQTSPDGITWTQRTPDGATSGAFYSATYGDGLFVLSGESVEIQTSPDGINWTQRTPAAGIPNIFNVATHGDGLFILAGIGGEIQTSPDGITWTQRTPAGGFSDSFNSAAYNNGFFVLAGTAGEIQTKIGVYMESGRFRLPYLPGDFTTYIKY
ncbi:MAG: hypothetical protein ABIK15_07390 [Pseudomonadota bacterium]